MGGDELIEFEESHYDILSEKFIEKYRDLWDRFVYDRYQEHIADLIDYAKDRVGI